MRKLFLAIRIPNDPITETMVKEIQRNFKFMDARWVEPQYLHMTLKFFGPLNEKRIKKIIELLSTYFKTQVGFEMNICKLAMFGSRGAPKVLWLGIEQEQELKDLATGIQSELDKLGLYADRQNFVPHISMARVEKTNSNSFFQKQMKKFKEISLNPINVNSIVLLESIISNKGVEYKLVEEFELNQ